jgi:4'-phosphopantetheinyl transferase EntD
MGTVLSGDREEDQMRQLVITRVAEFPLLEAIWNKKAEATMKDLHANRKKEWVNGRVALTEAFRRLGISITPEDEFEGYQRIKRLPDFVFSISHTPGFAGALVMKGNFHPGLDIEKREREVSDQILERFSHPEDEKLHPLLMWSVKEAAYKTLPSEIQEKIWLQSIRVRDGSFSGDGFFGSWKELAHPELVVVEAFRSK